MDNYLSEEEILLIQNINIDLQNLIDKYGKKELLWGAKWLLNPSIISHKMILKDDKGWEKELLFDNKENHPPNNYRIRNYPKLNIITTLQENEPQLWKAIDFEFRLSNHRFVKRECGCIDAIYEYEMI